jgi:hypothetical protein
MLRCAIALTGFVVAAAAFGAEPPKPSAEPSASTQAATEGLICRDRLRPGSHIAMRTCLTAAQWAAARAQGRFGPRYGGGVSGYVHEGVGPWGQVSTTAQSVGVNVFTAR